MKEAKEILRHEVHIEKIQRVELILLICTVIMEIPAFIFYVKELFN